MITFHSASWDEYYNDPERPALWAEHYAELNLVHEGKMPMNPDVQGYRNVEAAGMLEIIVARELGKMVGYCLLIVRRHMHYSALCSFEDSYFMSKSARKGSAGIRLIKKALAVSKARGCVRTYWTTKAVASVYSIFERLGFERGDLGYTRWLEDC